MRKDYDELPEEIKKEGMDFHWDNQKVWALDIPMEEIEVSEIEWHLDFPFWRHEEKKYTLRPRVVMENIESYPHHKERILNADIVYPIDLMENLNGRLVILDGLHRLTRLMLEGNKRVKVRKISREFIPFIEI